MKRFFIFIFFFLTGCSILYRPDLEQGNIISSDKVAQLRLGMSTQEVRYIMGNPVLSHSFDIHRWDYIYTYRKSTNPTEVQRLSLFFSNNRLEKITPIAKYIATPN